MTESNYKKVPLDENLDKQDTESEHLYYGYGVRHIQALLMFISLTVGYMARAHLGVTIVAMTDSHDTHNISVNNTNLSVGNFSHVINETSYEKISRVLENTTELTKFESDCSKNLDDVAENKWKTNRTYSWPKSTQELILGSFFLGYALMMFPIGLVCQRWGGKLPLQIALGVNGVVSMSTPWLTPWGNWKILCVCRIMQGMSQSGFNPGLHTLLARWVPLSERGSLSSYVYTGTLLGTVAAFQTGGILGASVWGWPSTFWLIGVLCIVALALFTVFGAPSPINHKSISEDEKNFILGRKDDGVVRKSNMPWKAVLTSRHVWATFIGQMGTGVAFVFFFTQVQTYMHAVLKVDIKSSGVLSSLPYVASFFSTVFTGYISDFLTNRKILSIRSARITCNSIGCVVPALCVAAVSFTTNVTLAVVLFVVAMSAFGMVLAGCMVNYMDLAPNFSGGLMAMGNTIANIFVVLTPILVSFIVIDITNASQWRIMLFVMVGFLLVTNAVFVLFMSSDVQPWNEETDDKEISRKT